MAIREFGDAILVLLGHGTTQNEDSAAPVHQHVEELRRRKIFADVREAFWKQEPQVKTVLAEIIPKTFPASTTATRKIFSVLTPHPNPLPVEGRGEAFEPRESSAGQPGGESTNLVPTSPSPSQQSSLSPSDGERAGGSPRVFIVPLFVSEGYFAGEVIPRELGFGDNFKLQASDATLFYCKPIGTHDSMTNVLLARAREVVEQFPFPRAPKPKDLTLFIAGHGTDRSESSRAPIERQVQLLRAANIYAAVHAIFLEESPYIADCYQLAPTRNIVIVPFFISDGLHTQEDIPVLLGEPKRVVQERLQAGQPTWRNPSEKGGKLVWYSAAIGSEPHIADVILERVREAAGQ